MASSLSFCPIPSTSSPIRHTPQRKDRFLALVLPWVLKANEEIAADRARLIKIADAVRGAARLSREERVWLAWTAERYEVDCLQPARGLAGSAARASTGTVIARVPRDGAAADGRAPT